MTITRDQITAALGKIALPDGGTLISQDMLRALTIEGASVRFVLEAPSPEVAQKMEPIRAAAEQMLAA